MTTAEKEVTQDPLGLKRFALTESAYDLVNSLRGTYARMSHVENQKDNPDQTLISYWRNRSKEIGRTYRKLNGEDLSAIEEFVKIATAEWRQATKLENERTLFPSHVS